MDQLNVQTKIGLVVVSASSISELRYPKAAPPGVAFLTSRMMLSGGGGIEALLEMESNAGRAVGELVSAKVDSVAYCCTVSGALRGMEGDRQFCRDLEEEWGTPITSTMLAVAEALQHMGMKKIVVTTPYPDSHHVAERAYLKEAGIEALAMNGMGLETAEGFASVTPQEIFDFAMDAKRIWRRSRRLVHQLYESRRNARCTGTGRQDRKAGGNLAHGHPLERP